MKKGLGRLRTLRTRALAHAHTTNCLAYEGNQLSMRYRNYQACMDGEVHGPTGAGRRLQRTRTHTHTHTYAIRTYMAHHTGACTYPAGGPMKVCTSRHSQGPHSGSLGTLSPTQAMNERARERAGAWVGRCGLGGCVRTYVCAAGSGVVWSRLRRRRRMERHSSEMANATDLPGLCLIGDLDKIGGIQGGLGDKVAPPTTSRNPAQGRAAGATPRGVGGGKRAGRKGKGEFQLG